MYKIKKLAEALTCLIALCISFFVVNGYFLVLGLLLLKTSFSVWLCLYSNKHPRKIVDCHRVSCNSIHHPLYVPKGLHR